VKLRIYDNSIRLRLTRTEVFRLGRGETIEGHTNLSPQPLIYELTAAEECAVPHATFLHGTLRIAVPRASAASWTSSDHVAIEAILPVPPGGPHPPQILIEKDFRCLHGPAEDQEDCFPNPLGARESAMNTPAAKS
jgi:hypothetical protein